ncbi:hypothetical protein Tco_0430930 [Tanacetum coccineum]
MTTTRQGLSYVAIEQLIAQCVADAIATYKANRSSGNGIQNEASGSAGGVAPTARGCSYKEFLNCKPQNFDGTEGVVGLTKWFKKMKSVFRICRCAEKYQVKTEEDDDERVLPEKRTAENGNRTLKLGLTEDIQGKVTSSKSTKIQEAIRMAYDLLDQVVRAKVTKDADNKRKWEDEQGGNPYQQQNKRR